MKYGILTVLSLASVLAVGCSYKQSMSSQQENYTTSSQQENNPVFHQQSNVTISMDQRAEKDKAFRRETFEKFINVEEEMVDNGERMYLCILDGQGSESERRWYRENIAHIDSISRYCIELSYSGQEEELLNLLISEYGNFLSHPVATSYICFDMNLIISRLYINQADKYPDYLQECIDLWELNRVQIEAVQSGWQEYHPLYMEVLRILLKAYNKVDNSEKVAEIQELINETTVAY